MVPPNRMAEDTAELRRTPLNDVHEALGARLVPFAGYRMPVQYEGIKKEHQAVRERAGLFDVSHMGELVLEGAEAVSVADGLVTNAVATLDVGRALYTVCCNEGGTILDDLIVYRRGEEDVLIVCNASNVAKISPHVATAAEGRCSFRDETDATALLALQGPKAERIARDLGADFAAELGFFGVATGEVAGVKCTVARTGYTGEDGFELFCANGDAVTLWNAILAKGAAHGIAPVGLGARDTLRLEAKLALYGNDIDETTNPYEAGLGWVVKLDHGEFVGQAALRKVKAEGVTRKLVGFEMRERGIARHGYPIVDPESGETIGEVTSGSPAPTLGKNIGLGYVPKAKSKRGTRLGIEIRGKTVLAEIVKTPFYKRDK